MTEKKVKLKKLMLKQRITKFKVFREEHIILNIW